MLTCIAPYFNYQNSYEIMNYQTNDAYTSYQILVKYTLAVKLMDDFIIQETWVGVLVLPIMSSLLKHELCLFCK
jgi:hypothetical protein